MAVRLRRFSSPVETSRSTLTFGPNHPSVTSSPRCHWSAVRLPGWRCSVGLSLTRFTAGKGPSSPRLMLVPLCLGRFFGVKTEPPQGSSDCSEAHSPGDVHEGHRTLVERAIKKPMRGSALVLARRGSSNVVTLARAPQNRRKQKAFLYHRCAFLRTSVRLPGPAYLCLTPRPRRSPTFAANPLPNPLCVASAGWTVMRH